MSTVHNYDATTDLGGVTDLFLLRDRILAAGNFSNPGLAYRHLSGVVEVTVDENDPPATFAAVLADLNTTLGKETNSLSLSASSLEVTGDGVDSAIITVTDSRGSGASGVVVRLSIQPNAVIYVDADHLTLDGSGQATFTFGPTPVGVCSGPIQVQVVADDLSSETAQFVLRYTL